MRFYTKEETLTAVNESLEPHTRIVLYKWPETYLDLVLKTRVNEMN